MSSSCLPSTSLIPLPMMSVLFFVACNANFLIPPRCFESSLLFLFQVALSASLRSSETLVHPDSVSERPTVSRTCFGLLRFLTYLGKYFRIYTFSLSL